MKNYETFADVMKEWPSMAAFGADLGINATHAQTMKDRSSIPVKYWLDAEAGAKKRGIGGVNMNLFARLARAKKDSSRKVKKALTSRSGVNHSRKRGQDESSPNGMKIL